MSAAIVCKAFGSYLPASAATSESCRCQILQRERERESDRTQAVQAKESDGGRLPGPRACFLFSGDQSRSGCKTRGFKHTVSGSSGSICKQADICQRTRLCHALPHTPRAPRSALSCCRPEPGPQGAVNFQHLPADTGTRFWDRGLFTRRSTRPLTASSAVFADRDAKQV